MIDPKLIREFVAIYGQDAYERLARAAESDEALAEVLRRALEGPKQS